MACVNDSYSRLPSAQAETEAAEGETLPRRVADAGLVGLGAAASL